MSHKKPIEEVKQTTRERNKRSKERIKARVNLSNENEKNGLPPDPWVVISRQKNNEIKAKWKAAQPKKERIIAKRVSPMKGKQMKKRFTDEQRAISKEKDLQRTRQWYKDNKVRVNEYRKNKRATNVSFRIAGNLRKRLSFLLRLSLVAKTEQTLDLLGCSLEYFMQHLQSNFTDGMSFENYGTWHIDHKKPCYSFDLSIKENREICFHYTNLQPLWGTENRAKSNKILSEAA